jgi:hypothetical protein
MGRQVPLIRNKSLKQHSCFSQYSVGFLVRFAWFFGYKYQRISFIRSAGFLGTFRYLCATLKTVQWPDN